MARMPPEAPILKAGSNNPADPDSKVKSSPTYKLHVYAYREDGSQKSS